MALAFDKLAMDVLELGVPFSDPLADGPVNQARSPARPGIRHDSAEGP